MADKDLLRRAVREGRFEEALGLLERIRSRVDADDSILFAELLLYRGRTTEAVREAKQLEASSSLPPGYRSRALGVLAEVEWHSGHLASAIEMNRRAMLFAEQARDLPQLCRTAAQFLERICDSEGFSRTLPFARRVREYAVRSADAHATSLVHVTFGRLEGKNGRASLAERHFDLARKLLLADPNHYLAASAALNHASVLTLMGDLPQALAMAELGAAEAAVSGWSRGKLAAAASRAFLYVSLGRITEAKEQLEIARREPFDSPSYYLTLTETQARTIRASSDKIRDQHTTRA